MLHWISDEQTTFEADSTQTDSNSEILSDLLSPIEIFLFKPLLIWLKKNKDVPLKHALERIKLYLKHSTFFQFYKGNSSDIFTSLEILLKDIFRLLNALDDATLNVDTCESLLMNITKQYNHIETLFIHKLRNNLFKYKTIFKFLFKKNQFTPLHGMASDVINLGTLLL